jgi:ABC-2 type transport system ATP-binding protein
VAAKRCEELSKGMQQKVQFLTAVIHRPSLIILDEPFSGLDPVNQRLLRDLVFEEHARGATVLFSTHVMVYAEQLCDHIVMIHKGAKVLDGPLDGIRARFEPRSIIFEPLDPAADAGALAAVPGIQDVARDGGTWELTMKPSASPGAVMQAVAAAIPPSRVELRRPTLEDVFIDIVSGGSADAGSLREAVREHGAAPAGGRV